MTFSSDNPYLTEHTWADVRSRVHALNPEFTDIVDAIAPDDKHTLFEVEYKYGDEILIEADFYLPNKNGKLLPISDKALPQHVRDKLAYNFNSNPVTMVLKNSLEIYATFDNRFVPLVLVDQGQLFGLWRILDGEHSFCPIDFPWGITAGARSIFSLSKISEQRRHQKLKMAFDVTHDKPKDNHDHFHIFRDIAKTDQSKNPWSVTLLFFSSDWFKHQDDDRWMKFNYHLVRKNWKGSSYWRNQMMWAMIFSVIQKEKLIKPSQYTASIVKHLFGIAAGAIPGLQPAINDNYAPVSKIQHAYTEVYGTTTPITLIQPAYFSLFEKSRPVYYPMAHHTAFDLHLKQNEKTTALGELYEIYTLTKKYMEGLDKRRRKSRATDINDVEAVFYKIPKSVMFDAFHATETSSKMIRNSELLLKEDPSFFIKGDFQKTSSFFNGCIRISKHD